MRKQILLKPGIFILPLFFFFFLNSYSQNLTVSGNIKDNSGEPLVGVSIVMVENEGHGTISDINGNYSLNNLPVESSLRFSAVGFLPQTIAVNNRSRIDVMLEQDTKLLDEIVVVGYGAQKKKLVTGATVQVSGSDIQNQSTISPLTAIQSKTPGMLITANSGSPGSGYKVNIRGLGTIGNSNPLYIIDGVVGVDLNTINPADIESIDVLKDAASSAIYGSRAANGVILITTKQGKIGKPIINVDSYFGVKKIAKHLDVLNAQEYMAIQNEAVQTEMDYTALLPDYVVNDIFNNGWEGTNWLKEYTNNEAYMQNHSIGVSGGTQQSTYSLGLSYASDIGVFGQPTAPEYDRYNFRINSSYDLWKAFDYTKLKIGENLHFIRQNRSASRLGGLIRPLLTATPLLPVYDQEGKFHKTMLLDPDRVNPIGNFYYNNSFDESKSIDVKANIYLEFRPIKDLLFRSEFGYYMNAYTSRDYTPVYDLGPRFFTSEDVVRQYQNLSEGYQFTNTLNYQFSINNDHNLSALVGQSIEKAGFGSSISGQNMNSLFDSFDFAYLSNVKNITSGKTEVGGAPIGISSIASFFGRLNYDYKEKYLFTAILRADGSSNFYRGKRWGYFPSFSAGWVLTNEDFMTDLTSQISFFKLRGSWGQNGNQAIPKFQYLAQYTFTGSDYFFGTDKSIWTPGAYPSVLENKDISWEKSEQLNIGFDSRFFRNKLDITFDWYKKVTKDWLVQPPVLDTWGAGAPYVNGGDVQNKGVELAVTWNDNFGDFKYSISGNIAHNKNEIIRIANLGGYIEGAHVGFADGMPAIYRAQVGYPIGYFYGYKTNGVFQTDEEIANYTEAKLPTVAPGDLIFVDTNSDGEITPEDRTMIGDPNPDLSFGLSAYLEYKGFDFSVSTYGVAGNQIAVSYHLANHYRENYPKKILERWHGEGTSNRYPRLTADSNPNWMYFSDVYIENGDFLRIQNITLGYDFKHLIPGNVFSKMRLYVSGQNLFTFTKYYGMEPEVANAPDGWSKGVDTGIYPIPQTFLVGLNLNF